MNKRLLVFALAVGIGLWAVPAFAVLEDCGEETETLGETSVSYDSCIQDLDYTVGDSITMTVDWMVTGGSCTFEDFVLKTKKVTPGDGLAKGNQGYTPVAQGNNSPALGTPPEITNSDSRDGTGGFVEVTFEFTELHSGRNGDVAIGNGHYKLILDCGLDGMAYLGVNVHVEDPV